MPGVPEFIAVPKGKEMFAVSSWRDSPGHHSVSGPSTLDALRAKAPTEEEMAQAAAQAAAATQAAAAAQAAAPPAASGRRARGGRKGRGPKDANAPVDVEDYFVHLFLPPGVAFQTVVFELQAQATPLRILDIGVTKILFPRRSGVEGSPANAAAAAPANGGGDREGGPGSLPPAMRLTPFQTPAMPPAMITSPGALSEDNGMSGGTLPPAMVLPPAAAGPEAGVGVTAGGAAGGGGGTASMDYQISLLFAEKVEADKVAAFAQRRWPAATVTVASRSRGVLNASLVLKGLPNLSKTEIILEELDRLPNRPSYIRLHRGERGVFKNVVFVKYANREAAEESKLRLERYILGTRPLKVEFKKKSAKPGSGEGEEGGVNGSAAASGTTAASVSSTPGGAGSLQQLVRDLRVSTEHEGFFYARADLTKDEIKMLKQLCQSYGLLFDMTEVRVTVKRHLGGANVEKPSPSLRAVQTPAWAPATPAPLRPMDFKGIRHWKDIRSQANTLGIIRPLGPDDGVPPFSAGRGRPL